MASSSSGLGRRPLKAEIAGSNPVEATKEFSLHKCAGFFVFTTQMQAFCLQAGFILSCRIFVVQAGFLPYKSVFALLAQNFGLQDKISGLK